MSVAGVRIEPLPDYRERQVACEADSNADGFIYPPQIALYSCKSDSARMRKLPRTTRPANVYHLPASHLIEIASPIKEVQPYSDANLLIQLVAFIFGTRLQFEEWRFDGRVPTKSVLNISITDSIRTHFLAHVYLWWRKLRPEARERVVNLFYVFNRASSAEMDWDAFYQQYMVFDGLFHLHAHLEGLSSKSGHEGRFSILCAAYGIPIDKGVVTLMFKARSSLFHEGTWAGGMMGYGTTEPGALQYPRHLARLNARLLCAIAGYRNSYTASIWWAMGTFWFNQSTE